jgi:hypothetical protein
MHGLLIQSAISPALHERDTPLLDNLTFLDVDISSTPWLLVSNNPAVGFTRAEGSEFQTGLLHGLGLAGVTSRQGIGQPLLQQLHDQGTWVVSLGSQARVCSSALTITFLTLHHQHAPILEAGLGRHMHISCTLRSLRELQPATVSSDRKEGEVYVGISKLLLPVTAGRAEGEHEGVSSLARALVRREITVAAQSPKDSRGHMSLLRRHRLCNTPGR